MTPPAGGQVYVLTPAPGAAGWAAEGDLKANHLGDYNIYAGVYEGQAHVGALQFDLAEVPPGAPIAYADLTLVGLSAEWLGSDGSWSADLLQPWLDENWQNRTYSDLAAAGTTVATLEPVIATFLGWLFLGERLEPLQILGAGLILVAVVILQMESRGTLLDSR